jgi:hypothetical protein
MKSLVLVVVLLAGSYARGDDCRTCITAKVVSVPDGGSLWVYVAEVRASYHLALRGIQAPPVSQPSGKAAQQALAQLVLGKDVEVAVERLSTIGETPSEVLAGGQCINEQMARILRSGELDRPSSPSEGQPRRPLLALCQALRILPAWTSRSRP